MTLTCSFVFLFTYLLQYLGHLDFLRLTFCLKIDVRQLIQKMSVKKF